MFNQCGQPLKLYSITPVRSYAIMRIWILNPRRKATPYPSRARQQATILSVHRKLCQPLGSSYLFRPRKSSCYPSRKRAGEMGTGNGLALQPASKFGQPRQARPVPVPISPPASVPLPTGYPGQRPGLPNCWCVSPHFRFFSGFFAFPVSIHPEICPSSYWEAVRQAFCRHVHMLDSSTSSRQEDSHVDATGYVP